MLNLSRSSDSHMGISMDEDAENFEALAETTVFLSYFKELPDHRQAGKVTYPLDEILLLCLLAVLAGAEAFTDIARSGRYFRHARRGGVPALFRRLGLGADQDTGRGYRDRWQNTAPLLPEEGLEGANPHGLGFRRPAAPRHGPGRSGGKIQ